MVDLRVGRISLSGEDSVRFVNSLFRPTLEEAMRHDSYINDINKNIVIRHSDEGFEANVADLDLSFLDDVITPKEIQMEIAFNIDVFDDLFFSGGEERDRVKIALKTNSYFSDYIENSNVLFAA